jgi:hypothetical protein
MLKITYKPPPASNLTLAPTAPTILDELLHLQHDTHHPYYPWPRLTAPPSRHVLPHPTLATCPPFATLSCLLHGVPIHISHGHSGLR